MVHPILQFMLYDDKKEEYEEQGRNVTVLRVATSATINFVEIISYIVLGVFIWMFRDRINISCCFYKIKDDQDKARYIILRLTPLSYVFILAMLASAIAIVADLGKGTEHLDTLKVAFTAFVVMHYLTNVCVNLIAVMLFTNSIKKWEEPKRMLKSTTGRTHKARKRHEIVGIVNQKFYRSYTSYLQVGQDAETEYKVLRNWFAIQYTVFLLSILETIIRSVNDFDTSTLPFLAMQTFSFLGPYVAATLVNTEHNSYYEEMVKQFLQYKLKHGVAEEVYTCHPGNVIPNDVERFYTSYYIRAREIFPKKIDKFDFVPSIFEISIPLNGSGYGFSILVSMFIFVLSIILLE